MSDKSTPGTANVATTNGTVELASSTPTSPAPPVELQSATTKTTAHPVSTFGKLSRGQVARTLEKLKKKSEKQASTDKSSAVETGETPRRISTTLINRMERVHTRGLHHCIAPMMVLLKEEEYVLLEFQGQASAKKFCMRVKDKLPKLFNFHQFKRTLSQESYGGRSREPASTAVLIAKVVANSPSITTFREAVKNKDVSWYQNAPHGLSVNLLSESDDILPIPIHISQDDLERNYISLWSQDALVDFKKELSVKGTKKDEKITMIVYSVKDLLVMIFKSIRYSLSFTGTNCSALLPLFIALTVLLSVGSRTYCETRKCELANERRKTEALEKTIEELKELTVSTAGLQAEITAGKLKAFSDLVDSILPNNFKRLGTDFFKHRESFISETDWSTIINEYSLRFPKNKAADLVMIKGKRTRSSRDKDSDAFFIFVQKARLQNKKLFPWFCSSLTSTGQMKKAKKDRENADGFDSKDEKSSERIENVGAADEDVLAQEFNEEGTTVDNLRDDNSNTETEDGDDDGIEDSRTASGSSGKNPVSPSIIVEKPSSIEGCEQVRRPKGLSKKNQQKRKQDSVTQIQAPTKKSKAQHIDMGAVDEEESKVDTPDRALRAHNDGRDPEAET